MDRPREAIEDGTVELPLHKDEESIDGRPESSQDLELARTASGPPYSIFSPRAKIFIVVSVSISSLISPFGATTFYPALDVLAEDLNVTPTLINLSLTTYMISQAIAPALIAGMSDSNGRRLSYIICFIIFLVANIGLALQSNYAALMVLRMVQAFGCSAAIALSNAVVADIAVSAERGKYVGYVSCGLLVGPSFGPTIGGLLAQYLGWRAIFWFLAIFSGLLLVVFTCVFPETCRNVVGNGSVPARGINRSLLGYLEARKHDKAVERGAETASLRSLPAKQKLVFPNPLHMLRIVTSKVSGLILLYNGLFFTGMMLVTAAIPTLYADVYHLNTLDTGLCYISMGFGSLVATLTMGHVVDWNFRRHAKRLGMAIKNGRQQDISNFPIERTRLEVVIPGHIIGTLAVIAFGWCVKFETSLAAPEVILFFVGFGTTSAFNLTNTLLIDLHRDQPATATAAVNFVRCLLSAAGAAAIIPMCDALNPGWAFTLLGFIYLALVSVVFLLMNKGQQWRTQAARKAELKQTSTGSEHAGKMEEEADTK